MVALAGGGGPARGRVVTCEEAFELRRV
jgi:hypothetical protein